MSIGCISSFTTLAVNLAEKQQKATDYLEAKFNRFTNNFSQETLPILLGVSIVAFSIFRTQFLFQRLSEPFHHGY